MFPNLPTISIIKIGKRLPIIAMMALPGERGVTPIKPEPRTLVVKETRVKVSGLI
jgi:hypothetical protein